MSSFHNAIKPLLFFGQLFGIMPIHNFTNASPERITFKWISLRTFYCLIMLSMWTIENILTLKRVLGLGISLSNSGAFTFISICLSGMICFLLLAKRWGPCMRYWRSAEAIFLRPPYSQHKCQLKWKIMRIAIFYLLFAIAEHCLYITSSLYSAAKKVEKCDYNISLIDFAVQLERAQIFNVVRYNRWWIIPSEISNISMTICWTFIDVFIMGVSVGLAYRFEQLNKRLLCARGKVMPDIFWIEMRSHYILLGELVQQVDSDMSALIVVSCSSNLYFICIQLFNSFGEIPFLISKIYFWLSLIFVICRTLGVLYFASSINDNSKGPLLVLRSVASTMWSIEVQRFSEQVTYDVIAFSGKRFFFLTRKLILAMAGTVVTYELVLLDEVDDLSGSVKQNECNLTKFIFQ